MLARRSALRAALNRRIQITGEYTSTLDYVELTFSLANVVKSSKPKAGEAEDTYKAGTIVRFESSAAVKAHERVLLVSYPTRLYDLGFISGPTIIDPAEGSVRVGCYLQLIADTPASELAEVGNVRIYVEGETV